VKKPTKVELIKLECFKTTSGLLATDQIELRVYLPQHRGRNPRKFNADMTRIQNGDRAVVLPAQIRRLGTIGVPETVTVELWEIDKGPFEKDDLLGRFKINLRQEPIGAHSLRFTGDGGIYLLHYRLDP
jgi:hypothetical protein